jgi:hypothetical protein
MGMSDRQFAVLLTFLLVAFGMVYALVSAPQDEGTPPKLVAVASLDAKPAVAPPPVGPAAAPTIAPAPPPDKPGIRKEQAAAVAMSVAAIAALLVQESRRQYYATGHPCACPDDVMRNGRRCGGTSAYSRPGGAAPLCYLTDVSAAMIERYRSRLARN